MLRSLCEKCMFAKCLQRGFKFLFTLYSWLYDNLFYFKMIIDIGIQSGKKVSLNIYTVIIKFKY